MCKVDWLDILLVLPITLVSLTTLIISVYASIYSCSDQFIELYLIIASAILLLLAIMTILFVLCNSDNVDTILCIYIPVIIIIFFIGILLFFISQSYLSTCKLLIISFYFLESGIVFQFIYAIFIYRFC